MKRFSTLLVGILGISVLPLTARAAEPTPAQVLAIFQAKCAPCHGPDVANPRGGFGYVLDLKRIASNPLLVVPSDPEKSDLWTLVYTGEMPPPDSPAGPLTDTEKEVIRAWIAAGAPADAAPSTETAPESQSSEDAQADRALRNRFRRIGKLHLLLLHFPIALLLAAAAGEIWCVWRRSAAPSEAVRFCVGVGTAAALPTVLLGWCYALGGAGSSSPDLLGLHRWIGTAAGLWTMPLVVLSEWDARRRVRTRWFRFVLLTEVVLVSLAAHFGGLLAHGADFFLR
jgi:uncharacterized membrane protein